MKISHEVDIIVGSACTRGFDGVARGGGRGARAQHVRACGSHARHRHSITARPFSDAYVPKLWQRIDKLQRLATGIFENPLLIYILI